MARPFSFLAVPPAPSAPVITSITQDLADTLGGSSHVIAGTSFTGATSVFFGTTPATSYVVDSGIQITAVAPANSAGSQDVTVTTPAGTSNAQAFEAWDPTVPATPTYFAERPDYAAPGGDGTFTGRSSLIGDFTGPGGGVGSPSVSSGAPLFVRADTTRLLNSNTPDDLIGRDRTVGCTIAVVLDITSINAEGAHVYDNEMVVGDTFQNTGLYLGGSGADEAILDITISGSVDKQARVSLGTAPISGRRVIVAERDPMGTPTPFVKITADSTPIWSNGDTLASDVDAGGTLVMGKSTYSVGHGEPTKYLDSAIVAIVCVKSAWSNADVTKFFKWASARHP